MLQRYAVLDDRLVPVPAEGGGADSLWLDLLNPTREEEAAVEAELRIEIPTREEMAEIEISSRLYRENQAIYMTAILLHGSEGATPSAAPVTFILAKNRLVTVRYSDPSVFRSFVKHAQRPEESMRTADRVLAGLLEAIIDRTADILEGVSLKVDELSRDIFGNGMADDAISRDYKAVIGRIGRGGDLNSRVRESLVSIGRLVNFLAAECAESYPALHERTDTMSADIRSLTDHSSYIGNSIVFLLDATLGLINIQQNAVIRILSIVSVVVMPPLLIASIYGMNFQFMPELNWRLGYPIALLSMVVAALIPYFYFKRRRWL